ncbi:MAG: HEAT repeat domain-containing protein [Euryarchaeota archaeon]|nr:HEAT repeat domain-containing protein [Euryarchaeota archaeon]
MEGKEGIGPRCIWLTRDGRCANCKARRYRFDAIGMKERYGECGDQGDHLICVFYRPDLFRDGVAADRSTPRSMDLESMVVGLRSPDVFDCRAALEDTKEFLEAGWADRKLLLAILPLTSSEDLQVRRDASWCLGKLALFKLGDPRSVDSLLMLTTDRDAGVRSNAAWALGELAGMHIGDAISIEALNILLTDDDREVRCIAAWALGRMADKMRVTSPSSVSLLEAVLRDESEYLRKGAAWSLERIHRLRPL